MTASIPLSLKGQNAGRYTALVDDVDADLAEFHWCAVRKRTGVYVSRKVTPFPFIIKTLYLHLEIAKRIGIDTSKKVDHVNGNALDNRRENLREATNTENIRNQSRHANNKSGFKGVSWHRRAHKWRAAISVNRHQVHLGLFDSAEEAARAYDEAALREFGEFARTNTQDKR